MTSEQWDIVRVPFPFTDIAATKKRPALVLSKKSFNGTSDHAVMAMITKRTNRPWPLDYDIQQWNQAGLKLPSLIRMKIFTIENSLIVDRLGILQAEDIAGFRKTTGAVLW